MPFEIVRNDLTTMNVDAIVNAANPCPIIGYGLDTLIHKKAGSKLLAARKEIGDLAFGDAAITPAFDLSSKYVIHAVSPIWQGGTKNELRLLENCYSKSLKLAQKHGCKSIAFPLLSAGNHGFPKELSIQTAIRIFSEFLMEYDMDIYLTVFSKDAVVLSEKLFHSVKSYIDDTYIEEVHLEEYGVRNKKDVRDIELLQLKEAMCRRRCEETYYNTQQLEPLAIEKDECESTAFDSSFADSPVFPAPKSTTKKADTTYAKAFAPAQPNSDVSSFGLPRQAASPRKLEDLMKEVEETFSESLIRHIDQKGFTDPYVYKKANIDRKLFSKIKNNKDYKPTKITCIAFAIALELNLDETRDLIGKAGYALTHSSKFDIIIEYFILQKNYNIFEINEVLFTFEQPLIRA